MTSVVDKAVRTFLTETEAAVAGLNNDLAVAAAEQTPEERLGGGRSCLQLNLRENKAMGKAAKAIRAAEGVYSHCCLTGLARTEASAQMVIKARDAGDDILRFAASAFRLAIGERHVYERDALDLRKFADQNGRS